MLRRLRDDRLGAAVTNEEGRFVIGVDAESFDDLPWETGPDLFFRVFHRDTPVTDTKEQVEWDRDQKELTVEIEFDESSLPPAPPTDVRATAGNGTVELDWTVGPEARTSNVYWATTPGVTAENGERIADVNPPFTHTGLTNGLSYAYVVTAVDDEGESFESREVQATPVAPLDEAVPTTIADETAFLYTGDNSLQTGVDPDDIDSERVAVLRGEVLDTDGEPIPDVAVSILDRPEFGQTVTRVDGMFDIVVNGGGQLTVRYEKEGYLSSQRAVEVPWKDYVWLSDVVLRPPSDDPTSVETGAATPQVARTTPSVDQDGERTPTVFFPAGTTALSTGTGLALDDLTVRLTEYSVGETGPMTVPAPPVPNAAYTYVVELGVDEAGEDEGDGIPMNRPLLTTVGEGDIVFDRPVVHYVENFLDFPIGEPVPTGFYDPDQGEWKPMNNGRIIRIMGSVDGLAVLDIDGTNFPANATQLEALGITDDERRELAQLYDRGQSVWRMTTTHFSTHRGCWPFKIPPEFITWISSEVGDGVKNDSDLAERATVLTARQQPILTAQPEPVLTNRTVTSGDGNCGERPDSAGFFGIQFAHNTRKQGRFYWGEEVTFAIGLDTDGNFAKIVSGGSRVSTSPGAATSLTGTVLPNADSMWNLGGGSIQAGGEASAAIASASIGGVTTGATNEAGERVRGLEVNTSVGLTKPGFNTYASATHTTVEKIPTPSWIPELAKWLGERGLLRRLDC